MSARIWIIMILLIGQLTKLYAHFGWRIGNMMDVFEETDEDLDKAKLEQKKKSRKF